MATHVSYVKSRTIFLPDATRRPVLTLELITCGPATVIALRGDLDQDTTCLLVDLVESISREQIPPQLMVDMAEVTFFGAAGIRALLHVSEIVSAGGGELRLCNASLFNRRVLVVAAPHGHLGLQVTETWPAVRFPAGRPALPVPTG